MTPAPLAARLADALDGQMTAKGADGLRHFPVPYCYVGMWVMGHGAPNGAPCSKRCSTAKALIAEARAAVAEDEDGRPRQRRLVG